MLPHRTDGDPHLIDSLASLEALYGVPSPRARDKVGERLSAEHRAWIERSGFVLLASVAPNAIDVSPRGDPPGAAFAVLDARRIALPDRRGNNRIDSLRHLVRDPRIALAFLVRGESGVLRVRGRAAITTEPALLERFRLDGTLPISTVLVNVEAVTMQETRAVRRAGLWESD